MRDAFQLDQFKGVDPHELYIFESDTEILNKRAGQYHNHHHPHQLLVTALSIIPSKSIAKSLYYYISDNDEQVVECS